MMQRERQEFVVKARGILDKELGGALAKKVTFVPHLPPRITEETLKIISKLKNGESGLFFDLARTRFVPMEGGRYAYEIQLDPALFKSDELMELKGKILLGKEEDYLRHEILHIKFYEMLPDEVREKLVKWHDITKHLFYTPAKDDFFETTEGKFFLKQVGAVDKGGKIIQDKLGEVKKLMQYVTSITDVSEAYTQFKGNHEGMELFLKSETAKKVARAFKELHSKGVDIDKMIRKDPKPESILEKAKNLR